MTGNAGTERILPEGRPQRVDPGWLCAVALWASGYGTVDQLAAASSKSEYRKRETALVNVCSAEIGLKASKAKGQAQVVPEVACSPSATRPALMILSARTQHPACGLHTGPQSVADRLKLEDGN